MAGEGEEVREQPKDLCACILASPMDPGGGGCLPEWEWLGWRVSGEGDM